ncbi:FAD-dependent monooxygenase [Actinocrispum sp. NPDC049592]|uniref:FAD-dependent monooxygenase n=1 Tax=Actinocrispum sp. NPDC049592 TaxID=3154835 RepID=UPI0034253820
MRTAIIVGGGIGGLAAATALIRAGWQVEVLEQAAEFTEVGAGLTLWPNALRALDAIGLGDEVRAAGAIEATAGIRNPRGDWLLRTDFTELDRRFGPAVALHRADLLHVLAKAVPEGVVRTSTRVTDVRLDNQVVVTHTGGESRADLLVAADGLKSVVRQLFWPGTTPIYSGSTAWRMILDRPGERLEVGGEYWGRGEEFGVLQLPRDQVYMFAGAAAPEGQTNDDEHAELLRRFGTWAEPIASLLPQVDPGRVMRHDIHYVPKLKSYVHDRVVLLGDAAHSMTPNMGQGGCMALEDAATLGAIVNDGLDRYDRLRRPRTQSVARMSRMAGRVGLARSRAAVALRDNGMRLVPARAMLRSFAGVFNWSL